MKQGRTGWRERVRTAFPGPALVSSQARLYRWRERVRKGHMINISYRPGVLTATFWPCENVNKTLITQKCRETNLTGNSVSSTRMAKCFLTKMTSQTKISDLTGPIKWTKKRTKWAVRENRFNILLMVSKIESNNSQRYRHMIIWNGTTKNDEANKRGLLTKVYRPAVFPLHFKRSTISLSSCASSFVLSRPFLSLFRRPGLFWQFHKSVCQVKMFFD